MRNLVIKIKNWSECLDRMSFKNIFRNNRSKILKVITEKKNSKRNKIRIFNRALFVLWLKFFAPRKNDKIERDRSCFVLSCRVLMLTDKCAWVDYFTCFNCLQKAQSGFSLSVCAGNSRVKRLVRSWCTRRFALSLFCFYHPLDSVSKIRKGREPHQDVQLQP